MFDIYTIKCNDRTEFEKAHEAIFTHSVRSSSYGDLDVGHADMIFSFSDKYHYDRAVEKLKSLGIEFLVDNLK